MVGAMQDRSVELELIRLIDCDSAAPETKIRRREWLAAASLALAEMASAREHALPDALVPVVMMLTSDQYLRAEQALQRLNSRIAANGDSPDEVSASIVYCARMETPTRECWFGPAGDLQKGDVDRCPRCGGTMIQAAPATDGAPLYRTLGAYALDVLLDDIEENPRGVSSDLDETPTGIELLKASAFAERLTSATDRAVLAVIHRTGATKLPIMASTIDMIAREIQAQLETVGDFVAPEVAWHDTETGRMRISAGGTWILWPRARGIGARRTKR